MLVSKTAISKKNKCLGCDFVYNFNEIKLDTINCPDCKAVCTKGVNCFIVHCDECNALFHSKTLELLREYDFGKVPTSELIEQHFQICNDKIMNLYDFENVNKKLTDRFITSGITSDDYQKKLFTNYKKILIQREQLVLLFEIDKMMKAKIFPISKLHQHVLKNYNEHVNEIEKITKTKFIHLNLKDNQLELNE